MKENLVMETERLILRQCNKNDVDALVEGLNNLNVSKWLARVPYPYTQKDAEDFINNTIENKLFNFSIILKEEKKVIGGTQITNIDFTNGTAGGGIWINEAYQGKGYGTEAFNARIKFAFKVLKLRKLENGYLKDNEKSHKMLLKLGYKDEGMRRDHFLSQATGKTEDEYIVGLLKDEWKDK